MDTPGHNDFGEDTYRILTSVDSAVMVIDSAKGVEAQTQKLFKVCSMSRYSHIYIHKQARPSEQSDPLELLEDLEDALGLPSVAVTWPIGSGQLFEGIYDIARKIMYVFTEVKRSSSLVKTAFSDHELEGNVDK